MDNIYENLSIEAKHAIFAALNDAVRSGETELGASALAASLLQTPSLTAILHGGKISLAVVLGALRTASARINGYRAIEVLESAGPSVKEDDLATMMKRLPITDRLVGMRLSATAAAAWRQLAAVPQQFPSVSVSSAQLLSTLLLHDPGLRSLCQEHGLTVNIINT